MLLGYARVSTNDQDTAAQVAALKAAGCERIYREKASGGRWERPELHRLMDQVRKGDVLVVWKLDRLSRSLRDLLVIMERLREAKAGFRSLTESIDTTTPAGRMLMQMLGSLAEFERAMLRERTMAGLESARREGRVGGRRPKLSPGNKLRSFGWSPGAKRPPRTRRGSSGSIRRRCRGCWRGIVSPKIQSRDPGDQSFAGVLGPFLRQNARRLFKCRRDQGHAWIPLVS